MITDHKPIAAIFKKDIASQSHRIWRKQLCINQYNIRILYNPGPQPHRAEWLCRQNPKMNKDEEIPKISIDISLIEKCTNIQ